MGKVKTEMDVITMGRSSIDLYSQSIGADFVNIKGFDAFVGGSPLNIAVGCSRLGLNTALLTAVGADKVGDFILNFLTSEQVNIEHIPKLDHARSSAVLLGIQPPDKFPLVFYRDNCADSQLTIDHVEQAQIENFKILEISGTALNLEPSRSAVLYALEKAVKNDVDVILDLDFRADQWSDVRSFGITTRSIMPSVTIAIGTEEEVLATILDSEEQINISEQQISAPSISGNLDKAIQRILTLGVKTLIVKNGSEGVIIHRLNEEPEKVPGFPVEVLNVLGAGDAFASGFIYGYLKGWDMYKSCRMGNASGAQVVLQPGCANFMPTLQESLLFIEAKGGF